MRCALHRLGINSTGLIEEMFRNNRNLCLDIPLGTIRYFASLTRSVGLYPRLARLLKVCFTARTLHCSIDQLLTCECFQSLLVVDGRPLRMNQLRVFEELAGIPEAMLFFTSPEGRRER